MNIKNYNIIFDKGYTYTYHDKYNEPCQCRECILFLNEFHKNYPELVSFVSNFGVNINYPLEIMDLGFENQTLNREYCVYYLVKGELPLPKIKDQFGTVSIVMRNWDIADEAYSNTEMKKPYFIIEISNIFVKDNKGLLYSALETGREIELHYNLKNYFISHNNKNNKGWYLYCEETKEIQNFSLFKDLLANAKLENININDIYNKIVVDCIL